jgi:membrane protein DedA with SNARE-associated domain
LSELLHELALWIEDIIVTLHYPGVFLVMFLEAVFPPIPSELIMPFAGFQAAKGEMNIFLIILAGTLGSVSSAVALYYFGWWAEDHVILKLVRRYGRYLMISERDLERTLQAFDRHGGAVVFFGRLLPVIRSLISIPAGMDKMPLPKFLLYTTLGSALWNSALAGAGMALGENWEELLVILEQYERATVAMIGVALAAFAFFRARAWFMARRVKAVPTLLREGEGE